MSPPGVEPGGDTAAQVQRALALIHEGRLPEAAGLCRQVFEREPRNFNALQLLGHIALQLRDYPTATRWLTAACSVNPAHAPVYSNLAVALLALERPQEALRCCDVGLELKPGFPEAWCNRGHALLALGRYDEALASYERALASNPGFYDALAGRIKVLLVLSRYDEALASADHALAQHPGSIDAWCQRGAVLLKARRPEEALAAFDRALMLAPDSPEAHNNRGTALRDLKRPAEALQAYERAARLRPEFAEVWCNAANVALDAGHYTEAIGRCDQALRIRPRFLEALNIRGTALRLLKRFAEAAAMYEEILARSASYGQAQSFLLTARAHLGDWTEWDSLARSIIHRVEAGDSASAPHAFLWICDSAPTQLKCAERYSRDQFPAATPLWRGTTYRHDRLRVAYLSADFADHPVAHLVAGVLERHDRGRFETFGISLARDPAASAMQTRMRQAFEHFHDVSETGDREVAVLLRDLEIDIAVDLTGHTRGGRYGILACRPAPIQIGFLGFAGTSGASTIDYLIGDAVTTPAADADCFSEKIIRMPDSFMPNDDGQAIAETPNRVDLGLPDSGFVFCAFNTIYKLNPAMFDIWMRLLRETPHSVLWLRSGEAAVVANLRREAERRGIDVDRLVFAPRTERMEAHLARYGQADLFLDTVPYGAHATARDALWAGLPVLTMAGKSFASRVASSLLTALEMPELIAANAEDYLSRGLELAHTPGAIASLRSKLARQRVTRSLFDTDLYCRHLEFAYQQVAARQRRGEPPDAIDVPSLR